MIIIILLLIMRKFLYVYTCIYNQMRVYLTIQNITKQIQ